MKEHDIERIDFESMPIGRLLAITGRMMTARFERFLEAEGLSHTGWMVLLHLGKAGEPLTLREVADRCYVTGATVTGVVDTLERDGLVVRERGTDDRRVVRLRLTKAGQRRFDTARDTVAAELGPLFADLTERDEAVVRRFLARTVRRLGAG